jgi:YD repeat-containing protein
MLSTLEEPGGKTVDYDYDAAGRRTAMDAYGEGTFTYNWDAANRQTAVVTPASKVTTLNYDPLNRVTLQTYAGGATTAQNYDVAGNTSQITHSNDGGAALISQLTYAYNAANQRTLQTWNRESNRGSGRAANRGPPGFLK